MPAPAKRERDEGGAGPRSTPPRAAALRERLLEVRRATLALAAPLSPEDAWCSRCPTPARRSGTSPTPPGSSRRSCSRGAEPRATAPFDPRYGYLFNSYYDAVGAAAAAAASAGCSPARRRRGAALPRRRSTTRLAALLASERRGAARERGRAGLHHEQQHQELLLTDLKHAFAANPLRPAYAPPPACRRRRPAPALGWLARRGGVRGDRPRRRPGSPSTTRGRATGCSSQPFALASRPVTCGEFLRVHRGRRLRAAGAVAVRRLGRRAAPRLARAALLATATAAGWRQFTLAACGPLDRPSRSATSASTRPTPSRAGPGPGCRPRRSGRPRRPTPRRTGNFVEARRFHPAAATPGAGRASSSATCGSGRRARTRLPRLPARGGRARRVQRQVHVQPVGAARRLVRHAAPARPPDATATSSRPDARWQFSGIRLARDA